MAGEQRKAAEQLQKINMRSCDGGESKPPPYVSTTMPVNRRERLYPQLPESGQFPGIEFTGSFKGEAQTTEGGREGLELR